MNIEVGQKRVWVKKTDVSFSEKFIGGVFQIIRIEGSLIHYSYNLRSSSRRNINEILENSVVLSPVLKELID